MKLLPSQCNLCVHHRTMHLFKMSLLKATYVGCVCLVITCHLHYWQNDWNVLLATAVTWGWNGYWNKNKHRKLTQEKKILPPLLPGLEVEPEIFHYHESITLALSCACPPNGLCATIWRNSIYERVQYYYFSPVWVVSHEWTKHASWRFFWKAGFHSGHWSFHWPKLALMQTDTGLNQYWPKLTCLLLYWPPVTTPSLSK